MECAAVPATSARPSSVPNARAKCRADGSPCRPKPAAATGAPGVSASSRGRQAGSCRRRGRAARRSAGRSRRPGPSDAATSPTLPPTQTARPSSSGWAKATAGVESRTPWADRSMSRKTGEATRSGWTAEQTSWRKPGRVSSAVRHPPPGVRRLEDVDRQSGPGQGERREQSVGAGPTTTASARLTGSSQCQRRRSRAPMTGTGSRQTGTGSARPRRRCVRADDGRARPDRHPPGPESHGVLGGRVAE